ncbi:hypothetical protein DAT35_42265 [Vitiosangium sp. GDMCC 1.1324]|nr:hypothetical protein DAT35_42265 [Vitiosangium sp. GDMCC 1.1324]
MYRSIEPDFYSDYSIVENPKIPEGVHFMRGALIQESLPSPLTFRVNFPKSVPLPHMLGERIPVVSDRFVAALRKAGVDNFQLFPAVLRNPNEHAEWTGFHVFNVLGLLDAADMDASKYQTLMAGNDQVPALVEFEELVLSRAATYEKPMFRIVQEPSLLLVHERVVDVLKSESPPDGWGIIATEVEVR